MTEFIPMFAGYLWAGDTILTASGRMATITSISSLAGHEDELYISITYTDTGDAFGLLARLDTPFPTANPYQFA